MEDCLLENISEYHYESDEEKLPKYIEDGQMKDMKQKLNSMNEFLILLVMSYVVSGLKILRMSSYTSMKPFCTNLELVIKKYFCIWH